MTTDDVLCSRVQLNELLDISSGDTFTDLGNACPDDIPEVKDRGCRLEGGVNRRFKIITV